MQYLPHTKEEIAEMLEVVGVDSLDDLFKTVPEDSKIKEALDLPAPMTEWELNEHMDKLAGRMGSSSEVKTYLGAGSYEHYIPATVPYILSRSEFITSYTPYQPEMSQGTLQAQYEYQTMSCALMGTEVSTASHYDGSTAMAEALLIMVRKSRKKKVAVSSLLNPTYRQVIRTYFEPTGFEIVELPYLPNGQTDLSKIDEIEDLGAVGIQSPNFFGCIEDLRAAADKTHEKKAFFIAGFSEALAYGLLKSPGSLGADLVAGDGQSLGIPRSFGGPNLGMLGSTKKLMRVLPGRLVGRTKDIDGKDALVLTLATREQHIRREKASSNICTNTGLCAVAAAIYMASIGKTGIRKLASLNHDKAEYLKKELVKAGFEIPFETPTFNEFVVKCPDGFDATYNNLLKKKIVAGVPIAKDYPELANHYLLCVTETKTKEDLDTLVKEVS
ncbi:MAG: aminomethyl-transferring glycine dehydrogenase subunit GcvPA [Deltaproteobacteria bacterium]|nr:aminomethyl-transferring glycine dehydrogenase subunit GcvPA [Deltaproteobacteria bacterium]